MPDRLWDVQRDDHPDWFFAALMFVGLVVVMLAARAFLGLHRRGRPTHWVIALAILSPPCAPTARPSIPAPAAHYGWSAPDADRVPLQHT